MGNFRYWRKMTWALVVWGVGGLVVFVASGFGLAALGIAVLGLLVLGFLWYMTRPLWRVGHGMRLRPVRAVEVPFKVPFKSPKSVTQD
jgi:uncharacterized protein (DUF58 family)